MHLYYEVIAMFLIQKAKQAVCVRWPKKSNILHIRKWRCDHYNDASYCRLVVITGHWLHQGLAPILKNATIRLKKSLCKKTSCIPHGDELSESIRTTRAQPCDRILEDTEMGIRFCIDFGKSTLDRAVPAAENSSRDYICLELSRM